MALSVAEKRHIEIMIGNYDIAEEISDLIDAGGGTLSAGARARLIVALGSTAEGKIFADDLDADNALDSGQLHRLAHAMGSHVHMLGVDDEVG